MSEKIIRKVLQIDGMSCSGCETIIENNIKNLDGVQEVKAVFASSNVYITYDANKIRFEEIIKAIENLEYEVNNKSEIWPNKKSKDAKGKPDKSENISEFIGFGVILFALYVIIKNTVGFNFIPTVNQSMGLGILFVVGLLTSLHCIAMCGGINLSQCVSYKVSGDNTKYSKLKPSLLYNLGRVISYTVIGGIVGAIGSVISFSGVAKGSVAIISGVFMVIMGLNMLNIFPWLRKLNPRMPKFFGKKFCENKSQRGPLFVGLLNGLMPCGPLQAMQIYALGTGSFLVGALSMFMFSLGTVPLMFGFGALSSVLSGKFTHKMLKFSSVLVMVLGLVMVSRGLMLSGINFAVAAPKTADAGSIGRVENGVQIVDTKVGSNSYPNIVVKKGVPVKWNLKAEQKDLNGCNGTVVIPKYNIQKKLEVGDNIIEFTPDQDGNIPYSCWMGMISGNIKVVDDLSSVNLNDKEINNSTAGGTSGGCCGG